MTHILVVDDERNLVELSTGYLRAEDYTVSAAYDGSTALEAARAQSHDDHSARTLPLQDAR